MVVPSKCSARDGRASEVSMSAAGTLCNVSAAKGIEEGTLFTMTDIMKQVLPQADDGGHFPARAMRRRSHSLLADGMRDRCAYRRDGAFSAGSCS